MNDTLRDRIAKAIYFNNNPDVTTLEFWEDEKDDFLSDADVILDIPGIAVVELPEPVVSGGLVPRWGSDVCIRGGIELLDCQAISVEYARDLAAALLAAADYAERDQ